MDPYDEQRLRDEVIYLHSLWHQGPPRPTPTSPSTDSLHQLSNRTRFKRERVKRRAQREHRRNRNRANGNQETENATEPTQDSGNECPCIATSGWPTVASQSNSQTLLPSAESGKEWPCDPSSDTPAPTSGWTIVTAQHNSQPILLSPEQQSWFAANQAQFKAVKATREFFKSNNSDGDDEIGDDDDEPEDDNEGDEDEDQHDLTKEEHGSEAYRFFVKVFEEYSDLRKYYEKNYQNGNFSCLVCGGVGIKKASKRFKGCVALIQHSVSITRTKKRRAHRAYGKAICKVLSWDIDRLPTIVSALSENLGVSLSDSGAGEGEAQGDVGDEIKDSENVLGNTEAPADTSNSDELQEKESIGNENLPNNDESIVSENSLSAADTSKCDKDHNLTASKGDNESGQPSDVEIPKEDTIVGDEGKDDDLVKNDGAS